MAGEKDFFADLVVRAVSHLDRDTLDLNMIGVKKVGSRCAATRDDLWWFWVSSWGFGKT